MARENSGTKQRRGPKNKLVADARTLRLIGAAAKIRATVRESAALFGVAVSVFEEFIAQPEVRAVWEKGEAEGLTSLRRGQFALAKKNATMSIHLGKVYLGQKDEIHVSGHITLEDLILRAVTLKDGMNPDEIEADT